MKTCAVAPLHRSVTPELGRGGAVRAEEPRGLPDAVLPHVLEQDVPTSRRARYPTPCSGRKFGDSAPTGHRKFQKRQRNHVIEYVANPLHVVYFRVLYVVKIRYELLCTKTTLKCTKNLITYPSTMSECKGLAENSSPALSARDL